MPPTASPNVRVLDLEAQRLSRLYEEYKSDSQFIRERKGRIIYFCDAHDLQAYINPNAQGSLDGFRIEAERVAAPGQDDELRLRSDQILSGLLFEKGGTVGLLPSHGKQMDHQIAYHGEIFLRSSVNLLRKARVELEEIGRSLTSYIKAAENEGSDKIVEAAIRIVEDRAPTLVALLRNELDKPSKRLQAVLKESGLAHWDALSWSDLGVDDNAHDLPSDHAPTPQDVTGMQTRLEELSYRHNTDDSNWADGSALIHLERLNKAVRARSNNLIEVRLVSRAWTLLQAAIDLSSKHRTPMLVRHPRLLALQAAEAKQLDMAGTLTLDTALRIYWGQIAQLAKQTGGDPDREEKAKEAAKAFVTSWNSFEKSRLALEAKRRLQATATPSEANRALFEQLRTILNGAQRPVAVLNQIFLSAYEKFGEEAASFLLNKHELHQPARVDKCPNGRIRVTPLTSSSVGPLELEPWEGMPPNGSRATLDELAKSIEHRSRAERFLLWSAALASAGRWKQSGFFAQAARQVAELEMTTATKSESVSKARSVRDEAALLRIEVRRLGARAHTDSDDAITDPAERFEAALDVLKKLQDFSRSRVVREEAAQLVETFLLGGTISDLERRILKLVRELESFADTPRRMKQSRARLISVLLLMHLVAEQDPSFWPSRSDADRMSAWRRRRELSQLLDELREEGSGDALPYRARALALIGVRVFLRPGLSLGDVAKWIATLVVPKSTRTELVPVQRALQDAPDAIAQLLREQAGLLGTHLRRLYAPSLTLAPVRPDAMAAHFSKRTDPIAERVKTIFAQADPIIAEHRTTGLQGRHVDPLERIVKSFDQLLEDADALVDDDWLKFHLRGERLLLLLLAATVKPEHERGPHLIQVDAEYQQLIVDFPKASLPYIRRYHIADSQDRPEEAIGLLRTALELVDTDPYFQRSQKPEFHWLQSFAHRRYLVDTMSPQANKRHDGNGAEQETAELAGAVVKLLELDKRDPARIDDTAHAEEARRRANNIVFYASRMIERGGRERLEQHVSQSELDGLAKKLQDSRIAAFEDTGRLHTLGCWYAATGRLGAACEIGRRIVEIIRANAKDQLIGDGDVEIFPEASGWIDAATLAADHVEQLEAEATPIEP